MMDVTAVTSAPPFSTKDDAATQPPAMATPAAASLEAPLAVTTLADLDPQHVARLVGAYGAQLVLIGDGEPIPGSYWGAPEAGLIGDRVYVRRDTPAHSLLHELCHYICMTPDRRTSLATDAGGDTDEECGVCYLQILLADRLPEFGRAKSLADMDTWGYSFREGSTSSWFAGDGRSARTWLQTHDLIDTADAPTLRLRL
jgi:hypothetical protein